MEKDLKRLGLAKEVLLVGHSYGGLLNQLYSYKYPKSVRGIVLIDPNTVAFVDAIGGPKQLMEISFPTTPPLSKLQQSGIRQITAFDKTIELVRKMAFPRNIPLIVITAGSPGGRRRNRAMLTEQGTKRLSPALRTDHSWWRMGAATTFPANGLML